MNRYGKVDLPRERDHLLNLFYLITGCNNNNKHKRRDIKVSHISEIKPILTFHHYMQTSSSAFKDFGISVLLPMAQHQREDRSGDPEKIPLFTFTAAYRIYQ